MLGSGFSEAQAQDFVRGLRRATEEFETGYELFVKEEVGAGLCAYAMRGVWRVGGAERYWGTGDEEAPHYGGHRGV